MAFFSSQWRVTLAGVQLLDFGDLLETELDITATRQVQEVHLLRGAAANRFPRGNVSYSITIAKVVMFETHALAQAAKLAALVAAPTGKGDCVLAINGDTTYGTFANACLASGSPKAQVQAQLLHLRYQIIGGALAVTTP